jgi:hypothetical protein
MLLNPMFVARYLSSDGVLTPAFNAFLKVMHISGLGLGMSLLGISVLLRSRFSHPLRKFGNSLKVASQQVPRSGLVKLLYALVILYVTWDVGFNQYQYYHQKLKPKLSYLQQLAPALNWLNEHTPPESVVFGSPDHTSTNSIIPIYTHNNVYVTFHSQFYTVPSLREIADRFYISMYVMGIRTKQAFDEYLQDHWFEAGEFPEYQKKFSHGVYSEFTTYKVDYLLYGPREQYNFKFDPEQIYPFLEKQYDDGVVKIFRVLANGKK